MTRPPVTIRFLAAVVPVALLIAACGGSSDEDAGGGGGSEVDASQCPVDALDDATAPVEVVLWHGVVGLAAKTLDQFATDYNASQDKVQVRVEPQGTYEEQQKKYTDSLRDPANLPGIMLAEDTNTQFMIDSQAAVPAQACIEADPEAGEVYDQLMEAIAASYSVGGVQWPGAFGVSTPVLYYNKAHFAAAGLDPEKPPANLEEVRAAAEAIAAAKASGALVAPAGEPFVFRADSWWLENLTTRSHTAMVEPDNGRDGLADTSNLLNDVTTEWMTWMEEMKAAGLLKTVAYSATFDAYLSVARQASSMLLETSTASTTIDALINGTLQPDDIGMEGDQDLSGLKFPDLQVGVGKLPGPDSAGSGQAGGNAWYLIGKGRSPEQIAAAWDFMKWVNRTENQVRWTMQGSYLPVFSGAAESPELQAYFNDTQPGAWLSTAFESLQSLDAEFPGPVIGPYKELRTAVRAAIETSLIGGQPWKPTFETANTTFQTALDDYKAEVGG